MRYSVGLIVLILGLLLGEGTGRKALGGAPLRLAVLNFEGSGVSGELADLGHGLQAMITTDLSQLSSVTVIERQRLSALRKEIDFSRSKWADKDTALKMGKLAGASHVAFGTYTVVGEKLRIDCRLVQIANGQVVASMSSEGNLNAFFEVAKELGTKLAGALSIKPAPKERAAMAKIQTADLGALQKFGEALRLFDQAKVEEAVSALEVATKVDTGFDLAKTTLSDYRALIAETRSQADQLRRQAARERARITYQESSEKQQYLAELLKRSASPAKSVLYRIGALSTLAAAATSAVDDPFEAEQIRHHATVAYLQLALKHWPMVPLLPFSGRTYSWDSWNIKEMDGIIGARGENLKNASKGSSFAVTAQEIFGLVEVDFHERCALLDELQKRHDSLKEGTEWDLVFARVRARRMILDLDGSTRILTEAKRREKVTPNILDRMAAELEINETVKRALDRLPRSAESRELVMYAAGKSPFTYSTEVDVDDLVKIASNQSSLDAALQEGRSRWTLWNDSASKFVLLNGVPLWSRNGILSLASEPRSTDFFRTEKLNYRNFRFSNVLHMLVSRSLPTDEHEFRLGMGMSDPIAEAPDAVVRVCVALGMRGLGPGQEGSLKAVCVANNHQLQVLEGTFRYSSASWLGTPKVLKATKINDTNVYWFNISQKGKRLRATVEGASLEHSFEDGTFGFWGVFVEGAGAVSFGTLEVK